MTRSCSLHRSLLGGHTSTDRCLQAHCLPTCRLAVSGQRSTPHRCLSRQAQSACPRSVLLSRHRLFLVLRQRLFLISIYWLTLVSKFKLTHPMSNATSISVRSEHTPRSQSTTSATGRSQLLLGHRHLVLLLSIKSAGQALTTWKGAITHKPISN
jgi:hypothetical protein